MDSQQVKRDIVVSTLQRRAWRQDNVRVPRRFIYITVDRHHELKARKCAVKLTTIRSGEHGVSCERHKCLHLTCAFGQDLFSEGSDRQLSGKFRQLSHAAVPARK